MLLHRLSAIAERGPPNLSPKWNPYLAYTPLEPDCTEAELERFLTAEEDPICAMCPAEKIMLETRPHSPLRRRRNFSGPNKKYRAEPSAAPSTRRPA